MKIKVKDKILFYPYLHQNDQTPLKGVVVQIIDDFYVVRWDGRGVESFVQEEEIVEILK